MNERSRDAAPEEPQVNKTLAQDTEAAARPEEEELDRMEAPRKQHGDALLDGSGTRHGVDDAQTRPNL